jgi:heme exporter protein C
VNKRSRWILAILMGAAIVSTFAAPNAESYPAPGLARIIFYHFPPAIVSAIFIFMGVWFSFKFLRSRSRAEDVKAASALEIGLLLATLAMVSGIIFSKVQWGYYWSSDPRLTSFLMVLLMYGFYFVLRAAFSDPEKRSSNAAGYAVASLLPAIFLIFVFPRLPINRGQTRHPDDTVVNTLSGKKQDATPNVEIFVGGPEEALQAEKAKALNSAGGDSFDRTHAITLLGVGVLLLFTASWTYRLRVSAGMLELEADKDYERMDDRGDPAPAGVVRPVSVHAEGGGQDPES